MTPSSRLPRKVRRRSNLLEDFRTLRRRCDEIQLTLHSDLVAFMSDDQLTFRWLPQTKRVVSVASTCTCLMTALDGAKLGEVYARTNDKEVKLSRSAAQSRINTRAKDALEAVFAAEWISSGLP